MEKHPKLRIGPLGDNLRKLISINELNDIMDLPNHILIDTMRDRGLLVRIRHYRIYIPTVTINTDSFVATPGEAKDWLFRRDDRPFQDIVRPVLHPKGGITSITIFPKFWVDSASDQFEADEWIESYAYCRPDEQYCKKTGVSLCLSRCNAFLLGKNIPQI